MGKLAHKYVQNVKKEKSNKFHGYPFLHGFRNLKIHIYSNLHIYFSGLLPVNQKQN